MRGPVLSGTLLIGLSAVAALSSCSVSATTIAYAADFLPGGVNYVRTNFVDPPETIGSIMLTSVGAFAGDDYSHQYWIDEALGRLQKSNVYTGLSGVIGSIDLQGGRARGMHWDPTTQQMFLTATDETCTSTTLYRIDIADASTVEIGTTDGCIVGLAVDQDGHAFGVDETDATLMSIDTTTGDATAIGPLNLDMQHFNGLDFDPEDGALYVFGYDQTLATTGMFVVDTASGNATLLRPYVGNLSAISFAPAAETIFADGFDGFACPTGRLETGDVAYSGGTQSDVDLTLFENLWGRSNFDLPPESFPGSSSTVTVLDFPMSSYVAAIAFVPLYTPEYYSGAYTYTGAQTPDNPHIDFSISSQCADFSARLGDCVAYDVGPDNGRLVGWSFEAHDYPTCVLHAGRNYFLNVRVHDPSTPSPACPGDACAIRITGDVALP